MLLPDEIQKKIDEMYEEIQNRGSEGISANKRNYENLPDDITVYAWMDN